MRAARVDARREERRASSIRSQPNGVTNPEALELASLSKPVYEPTTILLAVADACPRHLSCGGLTSLS